jgi:hypothetical protein
LTFKKGTVKEHQDAMFDYLKAQVRSQVEFAELS